MTSKPPSGRRMKAHAPPPPQAPQPAPRRIFKSAVHDGGGISGVDTKENILRHTVDFQLTLPNGHQTAVTEDGSKALMDLLVELCSRFHLNPALHTLELLSPEGHDLVYKPNMLLGSLNAACVLIKEKVGVEKLVRRPVPKVPENAKPVKPVRAPAKKTVRLMVNYHGSQKAVVRVNPLVPLQTLVPVICEKCEFDPAHVLLLKDSVSRHELQLDKSLTELDIKELYVHDQSLVLQPKMASAPALNHSDSIHSSTSSLSRSEKTGFLGIFQFNRGKTKTRTTSMDVDDCDDKVNQNSDTQSNGPSYVLEVSRIDDRPSTLSQSQSVTNIPRMSPKAQTKKRRAPALPGAPTSTMEHTNLVGYQMGSDSQQRKRKAPVPPPTPGPDDTSTSAATTPDSHTDKTLTPASCTKEAQASTICASTVVTEIVKPVPLKTELQPSPVCASTPTNGSPNPSSSTTDSLAVQDSSSDRSHSLDDSDIDQNGSQCSSLTSSTVSGSVLVQATLKSSRNRMDSEMSASIAAKLNQETTSACSSRSESEVDLNLKVDEAENRHSTMEATARPAPPKPRRSPVRESPRLMFPHTLSSPSTEPTERKSPQNSLEGEQAAPQSWLHSAASEQKPEEETISLGSSSGGSSLPDQGYAASEEMAEGEDSGMVSSPSDTQPTSPDGSLSLYGGNQGGGGRLLGPVRDNSSDSDEGCATWGSRYRHKGFHPQPKSSGLKGGYEDDPVLTAQFHQTLADLETDLADLVSVRETTYTVLTGGNEVPVSVVDVEVPVTAIDDVLEDYDRKTAENEAKSLTRTVSFGSKGPGFSHQSSAEPQNKNNNACTASEIDKISSASFKQLSQPKQSKKSLENKSKDDKKEEKKLERKIKEMSITDNNSVKRDKPRTSAVRSNVDPQKRSKSTEIKPNPVESNSQSFQEKKPVISATIQRAVSTEKHEEMPSVYQDGSSTNPSHGKITRNVTSRFGTKTFTVVPPKPIVVHAATGEPAVTLSIGAIKIDDQGNMVKAGFTHNKVGGSSKREIEDGEGSPLLGKVKAFWSSNERQESAVRYNKSLIDKAKGSTDGLKNTPTALPKITLKTGNISDLNTSLPKPAERTQPKKVDATEALKEIEVMTEEHGEVESKISMSKHVQQPSNNPPLVGFLKPSRRTSSHYVASAINKYSSRTSAKPNSIHNLSDSSASLQIQTIGVQRSSQSIQVDPQQPSLSFLSHNKENKTAFKVNPSGPKRSKSHPEYVSDSQRDFVKVRNDGEGIGSSVVNIRENSTTLETETTKNMYIKSIGTTHINMVPSNDRDNIKHNHPRSSSPARKSSQHLSAKSPTAPKAISQDWTSNTRNIVKADAHLTADAKPQPPVTETDSGVTTGVLPVSVFGPVKKFRPVICRSMETETSLHSSLMEAIQTGGGKDRLKKINTPSLSIRKKTSYVEEENERSTLLADIRAQGKSGKLRKTKSEGAGELEEFRKASEEERSAFAHFSPSSPFLICTSPPPVFSPPPVPQAHMILPPPPPPSVLPLGKPSTLAHPSANAPVNPALAREAILDAIRSGAAAEKLKKVAVPTKTVKVNGRLGTMQATSSTLLQQ